MPSVIPTGRATVLVADDSALVREGLKRLVREIVDDMEFVEAEDSEGLTSLMRSREDFCLAVIGLSLPYLPGRIRLVNLYSCRRSLPIIVLSNVASQQLVRQVIGIPAVCAFIPMESEIGVIRTAIEKILGSRRDSTAYIPPQQLEHALTHRQGEVYSLLHQGLSNKMIAGNLGISEGTVKNHVTQISRVLGPSKAARPSTESR